MRTTLTLDEDVSARLREEARRTGRTFKETVNEILRRGLAVPESVTPSGRFTIEPRSLGRLRPGLDLDNVAELLDAAEGPENG